MNQKPEARSQSEEVGTRGLALRIPCPRVVMQVRAGCELCHERGFILGSDVQGDRFTFSMRPCPCVRFTEEGAR